MKIKSRDLTFQSVIRTTEFENFVEREKSREILRFFKACDNFHERFEMGKFADKRLISNESMAIYTEFVSINAPHRIELSVKVSDALESIFSENEQSYSVGRKPLQVRFDTFNDAKHEVFLTLKSGSFRRFLKTLSNDNTRK